MSIIYEERKSSSPYVETITHGWTENDGSEIRPAECCWHMVLLRQNGRVQFMVTGPLTTAGVVSYTKDAEMLWIKFRLGTFLPALPARNLLDNLIALPEAAYKSFWLDGSTWQLPTYDNADTFVDRLVRNGLLLHDEAVNAVLQDEPQAIAPRTVRHRFKQATGLSQNHIFQIERAKQAEALLQRGVSILDTVEEAGYYDQPHLTRALKQWIGQTPAQIIHMGNSEQFAIIYKTVSSD